MRRFSILGLMGLILAFGVAVAALREANEVWSSVMPALVLILLGVAVLGAIYGRDAVRVGWLGFALFGGVYHLLAAGPWVSDRARPNLPTTRLLDYVHSRVVTTATGSLTFTTSVSSASTPTQPNSIALVNVTGTATGTNPSQTFTYLLSSAGSQPGPSQPGVLARFLPGAANYEPFLRVGHALFTPIFGLIGAMAALRFYRQREGTIAQTRAVVTTSP
jgi:hypothetical protein